MGQLARVLARCCSHRARWRYQRRTIRESKTSWKWCARTCGHQNFHPTDEIIITNTNNHLRQFRQHTSTYATVQIPAAAEPSTSQFLHWINHQFHKAYYHNDIRSPRREYRPRRTLPFLPLPPIPQCSPTNYPRAPKSSKRSSPTRPSPPCTPTPGATSRIRPPAANCTPSNPPTPPPGQASTQPPRPRRSSSPPSAPRAPRPAGWKLSVPSTTRWTLRSPKRPKMPARRRTCSSHLARRARRPWCRIRRWRARRRTRCARWGSRTRLSCTRGWLLGREARVGLPRRCLGALQGRWGRLVMCWRIVGRRMRRWLLWRQWGLGWIVWRERGRKGCGFWGRGILLNWGGRSGRWRRRSSGWGRAE